MELPLGPMQAIEQVAGWTRNDDERGDMRVLRLQFVPLQNLAQEGLIGCLRLQSTPRRARVASPSGRRVPGRALPGIQAG